MASQFAVYNAVQLSGGERDIPRPKRHYMTKQLCTHKYLQCIRHFIHILNLLLDR